MLSSLKTILLTDDHVIVRKGIIGIIQDHDTAFRTLEAEDFAGMKKMLEQKAPGHLILDLKMPDCSLMEPLNFVRQHYPGVFVLVFTGTPFAMVGDALLRSGASGYLSKHATAHETAYGINHFLKEGVYWPANIRRGKAGDDPYNPFSCLSERELIVTGHLLNGLMVKQIATKLSISATAVSTYKARVFNKLKVDSLMDVGQMANIFSFPV